MQIYVCDDEPQMLDLISAKIQTCMPEDTVTGFSSGRELMDAVSEGRCDILFLDIDMPELSGMDIAHRLSAMKEAPLLVFVTSHDELVYESLQYHPFGFIRKSYFSQEIQKVLEDCKRELSARQKHFHFRTAGQEVMLPLSDILYFEAEGNYLRVHTPIEQYRFRSTVTAVEHTLANSGFVRVHKGFLVNLAAVRMIGNEELKISSGEVIPLGKSYGDEARRRLLQYMRV